MAIKTIEKKISRFAKESSELQKDQANLKKQSGKRNNARRKQNQTDLISRWKKLSKKVTNKWIGEPDAVDELRYQRNK
ncbi:MAG: hypothetical protein KJ666_13835 [Bacteroidetes bacterium]|nr:hypothetical protein [Bacteroidota bacterium]MBU2584707.1 hypothetical protein [Bacteroidota bacterium]